MKIKITPKKLAEINKKFTGQDYSYSLSQKDELKIFAKKEVLDSAIISLQKTKLELGILNGLSNLGLELPQETLLKEYGNRFAYINEFQKNNAIKDKDYNFLTVFNPAINTLEDYFQECIYKPILYGNIGLIMKEVFRFTNGRSIDDLEDYLTISFSTTLMEILNVFNYHIKIYDAKKPQDYDSWKPLKLSTLFTFLVKKNINKQWKSHDGIVRIPAYIKNKTEMERYQLRNGEENIDNKNTMARLKYKETSNFANIDSLDRLFANLKSQSTIISIADNKPNPEELVDELETKRQLDILLKTYLTTTELIILSYFFGYSYHDEETNITYNTHQRSHTLVELQEILKDKIPSVTTTELSNILRSIKRKLKPQINKFQNLSTEITTYNPKWFLDPELNHVLKLNSKFKDELYMKKDRYGEPTDFKVLYTKLDQYGINKYLAKLLPHYQELFEDINGLQEIEYHRKDKKKPVWRVLTSAQELDWRMRYFEILRK